MNETLQDIFADTTNILDTTASPHPGSCTSCRYWLNTNRLDIHEKPLGECRRSSPAVGRDLGYATRIWATTYPDDWCGEYQNVTVLSGG